MNEPPVCRARWLGRIEYDEARRFQQHLAKERAENRVPDTLLLLEHPPVYTYGRRRAEGHFVSPQAQLEGLGARVFEVDRGGGLTFHGPGQLIGYPIIHLSPSRPDVHGYVRSLEEVIIRTLADYGIEGEREAGLTGVWAQQDKIAAIGVKVSRWVTSHGFALNVNVDLQWFRHIVACGISDRGVTSMERLLGQCLPLAEVADKLIRHFGDVLGRRMEYPAGPAESINVGEAFRPPPMAT